MEEARDFFNGDNEESSKVMHRMLSVLLARSSPPEVVLPECPYDGYTMLTAEYVWCKCVAVFTEALAAAGVPVKEVGRE